MYIVQSPFQDENLESLPRIFLAGCANTDWRKEFVKYFDLYNVVFLDPKVDDWDAMDKGALDNQIKWEFKNLQRADIIVYWFNGGSVCPITLLELGMWGLSRGTPMVIGHTGDYEKIKDIVAQTKLARPDVRITHTLEELYHETKGKMDEIDCK